MKTRVWQRSGIEEDFDVRQERLLELVYDKVRFYYLELHGSKSAFRRPLSLSLLAKLCNRSGSSVIHAIRVLANTIRKDEDERPRLFYRRASAKNNKLKRPYRIYLRR